MYLQENLGALSGPLLTDDQVAALTQAINDAISRRSTQLGRPLTPAEQIIITNAVKSQWGVPSNYGGNDARYNPKVPGYGTNYNAYDPLTTSAVDQLRYDLVNRAKVTSGAAGDVVNSTASALQKVGDGLQKSIDLLPAAIAVALILLVIKNK